MRNRLMAGLGVHIANPRNAFIGTAVCLVLLVVSVWQSQGRHVGHVLPGAPELHNDSRYNQDVEAVVSRFGLGLDMLTVVVETPKDGCYKHDVMAYADRLTWYLTNVPGVLSTQSLPTLTKLAASGVNEGNPKWASLPQEELTLGEAVRQVPEGLRLYNADCTLLPVNLYLTDHKASTIKEVVAAVKAYRDANPFPGVTVRLASGNAGVQAATNEVLEATELPMMLYVYATIVVLVFLTYRDWRAVVACCLPLTLAAANGASYDVSTCSATPVGSTCDVPTSCLSPLVALQSSTSFTCTLASGWSGTGGLCACPSATAPAVAAGTLDVVACAGVAVGASCSAPLTCVAGYSAAPAAAAAPAAPAAGRRCCCARQGRGAWGCISWRRRASSSSTARGTRTAPSTSVPSATPASTRRSSRTPR